MKYVFFVFIFVVFIAIVAPKELFAHSHESNRTISVDLHVDPEDKPVAGEVSTIHFIIDDDSNKFSLKNCNCVLKVVKDNKVIFSKKLPTEELKNSVYSTGIEYSFPEKGSYKIQLKGTPTVDDLFEEFSFSWDFQVHLEKSFSLFQNAIRNVIYVLIGISIVVGVATFQKKS